MKTSLTMSTFSKTILTICVFLSSIIVLQAQNKDDDKYLAGAVPEIDGKVVFSESIQTQHSIDQITELIEQWAKSKNETGDKFYNNKIIYNDAQKHEIALLVEDRLIFSNTALSLDYAMINYYLIFEIKNNLCDVTIKGIKYKYSDNKEMLSADEMISDKAALNKEKTKMYRVNDKFRKKTVDMADNIFDEIEKYLNKEEYDAVENASKSRRGNNIPTAVAEKPVVKDKEIAVEQSDAKFDSKTNVETIETVATVSQNKSDNKTTMSPTETALIALTKQKSFAMSNFFIVGESVAYVRQLSAISTNDAKGKTSIICYIDNDGTVLQQSQIMPSGKFKILYYTPDSNSYNKLADLSKKYAKGESYSDTDIAMIEVFVENSNDAFRINHLKIETVSTNNISSNSTIGGLPSVGKFIKTNKTVVITGSLID